jgi:hypothetical protein
VENKEALHAHITELEELVEDLLVGARTGSHLARDLAVSLHRDVMKKRHRLRGLKQNND